jgi:excisionase family DNA binding protein
MGTPHLGLPRIKAELVFVGAGVRGERSESRSDAAGALDARSGDHTMSAAGEAARPRAGVEPATSEGVRTRYLTIVEASTYLNVSVGFLRGVVADRRVRFCKVGKFLRFDVVDLDALAETFEVGAGDSDRADRVWLSARRLG